MPITIRTMPIEALIPADYNPRTLSAKARRKLAASLDTFGLVEPLVWNERTGRLVGGHQRLALLRERGETEVPVSVVNLSEAQEKSLNLMLNNLEAQGRYDPDRLALLLEELQPLPEFEFSGFDESDLANLRLEPVEFEPEPHASDVVEIQLTTDRATYEALSPKLDGLIREFDLSCHVQLPP